MYHDLLLIFAFVLSNASPLHALFSSFMYKYDKTYDSEEERYKRYSIFKENLRHIDAHNADPSSSYKMAMNPFMDLSREEFKAKRRGYDTTSILRRARTKAPLLSSSRNSSYEGSEGIFLSGSALQQSREVYPKNVDWANPKLKKVSSVKDQLYCGGCWAFAVADAVESRWAIKHKRNVIELSIQELIDCDHNGVNEGCVGGNLPEGYEYVIDQGGMCTSKDYKFTGYDQRCKKHHCQRRLGKIRDYGIVIRDNEVALREAVAQGPVAIAIEADADAMQFYDKGILTTRSCGTNVDHAVTIVGYGEDHGMKYWKIKNSWSRDWGEGGYMRLCRECGRNGKTGECGITVEAVFPIV